MSGISLPSCLLWSDIPAMFLLMLYPQKGLSPFPEASNGSFSVLRKNAAGTLSFRPPYPLRILHSTR